MNKKFRIVLTLLLSVVLLNDQVVAATIDLPYVTFTGSYRRAGSTYYITNGQTVQVSWTNGNRCNVKLHNFQTNNETAVKTSNSGVQWTGMKQGTYVVMIKLATTGSTFSDYVRININ